MAKTRKYSYWEQRRARELYGLLVTAEESAEQLRQVYFLASRETEEEAIRIVRRFQLKHSLTEKEAFALLEKVRDPADIKAVMKQLKKNPKNAELVAEAEAPAYAARIRQLQAAQKGVDQTALRLFQTTKAKTDETLEYVAKESYYREAFALDQQIGAAFPFGDLKPQDIQKILDTRWEGANYSERIWNNTQALADRVKREMLVSVLTGKTNEKIAREIADDFGVSFNAARRLVRTEACYVSNQIQMEIYKRTGVTEYIYSAILDMRTSPVCRSLDGKRFKVKKAQVGKNYPPMHPWCRSTTIAAMPESLLEKLKRTARDAFGRLIKVPASMTYEDWKQKIFRPINGLFTPKNERDTIQLGVEGQPEKMAASTFSPLKAKPVPGPQIDPKALSALTAKAEAAGIEMDLVQFGSYSGDVMVLEEMLADISESRTLWGKKCAGMRVRVGYKSLNSLNDFAVYEKGVIYLNKDFYDDSAFLAQAYAQQVSRGHFVKGTTYRSIPLHEVGHRILKQDTLAYSRVMRSLANQEGILPFAVKYLGDYAAVYKRGRFTELISELFSATLSTDPSVADAAKAVLEEAL